MNRESSQSGAARHTARIVLARPVTAALLAAALTTAIQPSPAADEPRAPLRTVSTPHIALRTDLAAAEATALAAQLESTLLALADYCDRPPRGVLEINVVQNFANWPEGSITALARRKILEQAGVTDAEVLFDGDRLLTAKAIVYASQQRDSARHELVHAYFAQSFGVAGPLWFAEGMAEVGRYWRSGGRAARCEARVADYLRSEPPPPLAELLAATTESGDSWRDYAQRWALCHLLVQHPHYSARFRSLCRGILRGDAAATLPKVFGDEFDRIAWEYRLFARQVEPGYRVDLCVWEWSAAWRALPAGQTQRTRVAAQRGWQASGLQVVAGQMYRCEAAGVWRLAPGAADLAADGDSQGRGRLEGAVWNDDLTPAFALGADVVFTPTASGRLMLRCRDDWGQLADNEGALDVLLRRSP